MNILIFFYLGKIRREVLYYKFNRFTYIGTECTIIPFYFLKYIVGLKGEML